MARLGTATVVVAALLAAACLSPCRAASVSGDLLASSVLLRSSQSSAPPCDGTLGQCAVVAEEEEEVGGDGAGMRRSMAQRQPTNRYISYAALRADQVPCNKRGQSYYTNCASQQQANPYRRGCSAITRCQRTTS